MHAEFAPKKILRTLQHALEIENGEHQPQNLK
jgi:hypothetical protein